jgi:hypothetical protein
MAFPFASRAPSPKPTLNRMIFGKPGAPELMCSQTYRKGDTPNNTPLPPVLNRNVTAVISNARHQALMYKTYNQPIKNPCHPGSSGALLWSDIVAEALDDDASPYPPINPLIRI